MNFIIGCNYWASNAGTEMWRSWDENAIKEDLKILSAHGIKYLRIFPNWRDFQPVIPIYNGGSLLSEYRLEGDCFPTNPYYLDDLMLERFSRFCDLCEEYGLMLIVGLVTGFMSGRMFIPPILFGKNLYTDPTALLFEQRLVKGMVSIFRDKKAIYAWDLGNECNCMCEIPNEDAGTSWTAIIANTIRAYDQSRPIISGIHVVSMQSYTTPWSIQGQTENCDMLVTHPYPLWSNYAYKDYTMSFRTLIHATYQTKRYADVSNLPCLLEEFGTMGPMICSEESAADFLRVNLISAWANGSTGFMWWCANEQTNLTTHPYTTNMCEVELGMIYADRQPKPVLAETKKMSELLSSFNFELPTANEDAVCLFTRGQNHEAVGFMTYALAKQAGLNLKFASADDELPVSDTYIMPSVSGNNVMYREKYIELKQRVYNGAVLYISVDNAVFAEFEELTGLKVIDSGTFNDCLTIDKYSIEFTRSVRYNVKAAKAQVLAYDSIGIPAVTVNTYGQGKVYFVNFPLENMLIDKNNAFDGNYYKIYSDLFSNIIQSHEVYTTNQNIPLTIHRMTSSEIYVVAINHSKNEQKLNLIMQDGYEISSVLYGNTATLSPFEFCIFKITKS